MGNYANKGFVYLVKCGGVCKLGYSVLPEQRIDLIRTDNSKPLEVLGIWEFVGAYEIERNVLDILYRDADNDGIQHIRGEWFKIPSKAIKELTKMLDEESVNN